LTEATAEKIIETPNGGLAPVAPKELATTNSSLTEGINTMPTPQVGPQTGVITSNDSSNIVTDNSTVETKKRDNNSLLGLNDKISELNKKLATTEGDLDKLKTQKNDLPIEDLDRVNKVKEDNKIIANLKQEITKLKEDAKLDPIDSSNMPSNNNESRTSESDVNSLKRISDDSNNDAQYIAKNIRDQSSENAVNTNDTYRSGATNLAANQNEASKGASEKNLGLTLTKLNVSTSDLLNTPINPEDSEILSLIENADGRAVIIREDGILKQAFLKKDPTGKSYIQKIAVNISKAEEKKLLEEAVNAKKSSKELGRDPARLYQLNSLINESVQRNK
ncbi:MAG: hypothetical protein Q7U04_06060, partial [Bacteriovorax sp.]|nr:hypothetical protein [Bacteriovorax sp.]